MEKTVAFLADQVETIVFAYRADSGSARGGTPPVLGADEHMETRDRARARLGALALGLSATLLGAFPFVRPFFRLDVFAPEATLAAASSAVASAPWVIAHAMAMTGFILLLSALPALSARLAVDGDAPRLSRAVVLSTLGIALVLPMFGIETYALPAIGQIYLDGHAGIAPIVTLIYRGLGTAVMLVGLLLLAIGALTLAAVIWRRGTWAGWAAVMWAVGLAAWLPLLPRPVRVVDGLLIGVGGISLAWSLWRKK
jgi:hypothetical protein